MKFLLPLLAVAASAENDSGLNKANSIYSRKFNRLHGTPPVVSKIIQYLGQMKPNLVPKEILVEMKNLTSTIDKVLKGQAPRSLGNGGNRFLVPIPLQAIWGYGCWCYFGDDLMQGQGTPVNALDGFCKNMQLCLRCAVLDGENCPIDDDLDAEDKTCDPKTQKYNSEFSKLPAEQAILADCTKKNDNMCAKNTCCCEMKFIADLLSMITSMTPFDVSYQHARGWDPTENCPTNPGHPGPNPGNPGNGDGNGNDSKACCGQYPSRQIYNKKYLECCEEDSNVFNPMSHVCCLNGVGVQDIGNCP